MKLLLPLLLLFIFFPIQAEAKTDEEIKQLIIQQSIAGYPGNCPCPYNRDRAGRKCGKRSAYSRPGGYSPICYSSDVTHQMIQSFRNKIR